jgi:hypothetical protein
VYFWAPQIDLFLDSLMTLFGSTVNYKERHFQGFLALWFPGRFGQWSTGGNWSPGCLNLCSTFLSISRKSFVFSLLSVLTSPQHTCSSLSGGPGFWALKAPHPVILPPLGKGAALHSCQLMGCLPDSLVSQPYHSSL